MQKKLIALAVAGLMAAPAFAQSNVTIYGRVDLGYMSRGGDNGGLGDIETKTEMASGIQGGSRLGFKGAEDLGNGLKAIFELEFGSLGVDNSNAGINGFRHAWVGLTGDFGTVVAGRLDGIRYGIFGKYDFWGNGNVGNMGQLTGQVDRADNAVAYISPSFAGFSVVAAYSSQVAGQENAGNDLDNRLNSLNLKYSNGPLSADLDFERVYQQGTDARTRVTTAAVSYDFGVVAVSGLYDLMKVDNAAGDQVNDFRTWFIAAKAPITSNLNLKLAYGQTKDKELDDSKSKKFGIGADYFLSKRTSVYASYGSISNDDNATLQLSQAGSGYASGYGVRGFDLGIAHKF